MLFTLGWKMTRRMLSFPFIISAVSSSHHILAPSVNVDICSWWRQVVKAISLQTAIMILLNLAHNARGLACPTLTEFM